jgi:DNA-binding MarR family transcriptional regulator
VARYLVMDKTTVSRNVATLVAAGMVTASTGADSRVRQLASTARGRRVFRSAMPLWESAQAEVSQRLGSAKFEDAVRQTRRLARALDNRR